MKGVIIKVIPHKKQRYPTIGDWFIKNGVWHIRVSKLSSWKYEFLVAFHELLEMAWCIYNGVTQKEVDEFDIEYERTREDDGEPGDDLHAPYYVGHQLATICEKIAAHILGVNWGAYDNEINSMI